MQEKIIVAVAPVGTNILPPGINPLTAADVAEEVVACSRPGGAGAGNL